MTLIIAGKSEGTHGRCDSKCHDAMEPECHCICGGHFHGKRSGSAELREAVKEHAEELLVSLRSRGIQFELEGELAQPG